MDKQAVRNQIKALLIAMSDEERNFQSREISERIISLPAFCDSDVVFLYSPLREEPDVMPVFDAALRLKKKVAFPVCVGEDLEFFLVNKSEHLKTGAFGILEPDKETCTPISPNPSEKTIIVVPGLGFDRYGHRLGRGRGFYDRYLSKHNFSYKVGCCFKNQVLSSIPYEKHDCTVELLWNQENSY